MYGLYTEDNSAMQINTNIQHLKSHRLKSLLVHVACLCVTAGFFTLRSIIAVELYTKARVVSALGLLLFFQGFALLAGHAVTGMEAMGRVSLYCLIHYQA